MRPLSELYQLAMETLEPDDAFTAELFRDFSELSAEQKKHIAGLPLWQQLFYLKYKKISDSVKEDFASCILNNKGTRATPLSEDSGQDLMSAHMEVSEAKNAEVFSQKAIDRAMAAARAAYNDPSLIAAPSIEEVRNAFSHPKQKNEIAKRFKPTLCFMLVRYGEVVKWHPVLADGFENRPLDEGARGKTFRQSILEMREVRAADPNPYLREFGEDALCEMIAYASNTQEAPTDDRRRSPTHIYMLLSAKFNEMDSRVRIATCFKEGPVYYDTNADSVNINAQLHFAVWGDAISSLIPNNDDRVKAGEELSFFSKLWQKIGF